MAPSVTEIEPGGSFTLDIQAEDRDGKPKKANLAVMVVDEGVLSLTGFQTPDPIQFLYHVVGSGTVLRDLRDHVAPRMPDLDEGELARQVSEQALGGLMDDALAGGAPADRAKKSGMAAETPMVPVLSVARAVTPEYWVATCVS